MRLHCMEVLHGGVTSQAPLQLGCISLAVENRRSKALLGNRRASKAFFKSNTNVSKRGPFGSQLSCTVNSSQELDTLLGRRLHPLAISQAGT